MVKQVSGGSRLLQFGHFTLSEWLVLAQHELLLFAGIFFLLGAVDELATDLIWLWLRMTGRARDLILAAETSDSAPLSGQAAVFIPAWREDRIIGITVRHLLASWPQEAMRLYVGCYANDPETLLAVSHAAKGDARVRIVVHDSHGPTTKADCLNRLHRALLVDEARQGFAARMVVLHDAEDMVDPASLALLDGALRGVEMIQLPVLPLPQPQSRWIGSHYCEEFAEAHGKALVVRSALGANIPLAGVGCALSRDTIARLANLRDDGPFATDCLTEDYELGVGIGAVGGRSRFLRARTQEGRLVATRAYFPARIDQAVRQKTRWVHGIAFQSWDRLGWGGHPSDVWMRLRDRRGPLTALVLAVAYALLILFGISWLLRLGGMGEPLIVSPLMKIILVANFVSLLWRGAMRFAFTAREYGSGEGMRAILRVPVTNIIAILAGRRALGAYVRTLRGHQLRWDKTEHHAHPAEFPDAILAA